MIFLKNSLFILVLSVSLNASESYSEWKEDIKNQNKKIPQEVLDTRQYFLDNMEKRYKALSRIYDTSNQEKLVESIQICINQKFTFEDINNCVPSSLKD